MQRYNFFSLCRYEWAIKFYGYGENSGWDVLYQGSIGDFRSFTPPPAPSMVTRNVILSKARCHSERQRRICSEARPNCIPWYVACAQRRGLVDVSAHKTTILHEDICSSAFPFRLCRRRQRPPWPRSRGTRDMHRWPSIYTPSGIIGMHISMQMSRYARPTLGIRLQWHH